MKLLAVAALCFLAVIVTATPTPLFKSKPLLRMDDPRARILQPKSQKIPLKDMPGSRIVNGQNAAPGQFAHQAFLNIFTPGYVTWCGASLISTTWVLTASHCVQGEYVGSYMKKNPSGISRKRQVDFIITSANVILGSVTMDGDGNSVTIAASAVVYHTGYNPSTLENDIAAIQLSQAAPINDFIKIIALSTNRLEAGVPTLVSGFGRYSDDNSDMSSVLRYASMDTITNEQCSQSIAGVPDEDVCAVGPNKESTCSGDSGGPLITRDGNGDNQVGIVSWVSSAGCGLGAPAGFVRVADFRDWINQATGI